MHTWIFNAFAILACSVAALVCHFKAMISISIGSLTDSVQESEDQMLYTLIYTISAICFMTADVILWVEALK